MVPTQSYEFEVRSTPKSPVPGVLLDRNELGHLAFRFSYENSL